MKKFAAVMAFLMFLPAASAGFISSSLTLEVEEPPAVPVDGSVNVVANVTLSWGFGMFFPLPVTVEMSVENVSDWLSVSITPDNFVVTPSGFIGGEASKDVTITLRSRKETAAFVSEAITLRAKTSGNFLLRGAEASKQVYVMQGFADNGITVEAPSALHLYTGEEKTLYFNVTNKCNSAVYLTIEPENVTGFTISSGSSISIPSGERKTVSVKVKADESTEENAIFRFGYYPPGHEELKNYESVELSLESHARPGGGSLAMGIVVALVIILIIAGIWKRKR
ncbi:MAG TPA: hypothetical protein ENJ70_00450 [Thermoplasmatales archaeon]|nr:hypothetical protein [Thermoplasmatales archaeon]